MHVLESQNFSDLTITQRRFIFAHLTCQLYIWIILCQELLRRLLYCYRIICGIEYLEAEPVFLYCQVTDLPQVAGINV